MKLRDPDIPPVIVQSIVGDPATFAPPPDSGSAPMASANDPDTDPPLAA
jgi:hypothetical protein